MAFTVPNQSGSIEDPTGVYPQAQLDSVDLQILAAAAGGSTGISSGCAVTAQGSPDNTVAVASGTVVVNNSEAAVSSGNVTMTAAHATLARFDFITVNSSGTKAYTTGTAAATPVFPAIPANSVVLAAIYVDANDNVINSNQIVDKRVTVPTPSVIGGWTTITRALSSNLAQGTTLIDDPVLTFAVAASGEYRLRGMLWASWPANHGGWKIGLNGPASPTVVRVHLRVPNMSSGLESSTSDIWTAYETTGVNIQVAGAGSGDAIAYFDGFFYNGSTAGNLRITNAQQTSDVDLTALNGGAFIEYARID